jgi:hypothetical protein
LKEFIEREEVKRDAYWRSILHSDTRNIFPKHELAKIEIAKNKLAKLRLAVENLPAFLSLQIYAKEVETVAKTTPDRELKKELNELESDITACRTGQLSNDYDFEILESKGKVETLCGQLTRQKIEPELREAIERSPKWKQYLDANCKQAEPYDIILNERDKANLAFNIPLRSVDDCLLASTTAKIIEERVKDEVIKHRLRQIFASDALELPFPGENDPFRREWQ